MSMPLPIATLPEIERVQRLYHERYGVILSFDDAKRLLEGVMQFIYLTHVYDALHPIREEIERERGPAGSEH